MRQLWQSYILRNSGTPRQFLRQAMFWLWGSSTFPPTGIRWMGWTRWSNKSAIQPNLFRVGKNCTKGNMSVTGHIRCGGCESIFPKIWAHNPTTGSGYLGAIPFCSQKCKGVILFKQQLILRPQRRAAWDVVKSMSSRSNRPRCLSSQTKHLYEKSFDSFKWILLQWEQTLNNFPLCGADTYRYRRTNKTLSLLVRERVYY